MAEPMANSGVDEIREHSTWFLVMGIALIVVGSIAIGSAEVMTLVSVLFLGWLLIFGGLFEVIHGFARRRWSGFFVNLLVGVLYAVAGIVMVGNPGLAAVTLTLLIAMILIVGGVFRLFIAFATPMQHRGWLIVNGAISVVLGFSIWDSWPLSGVWVIGLFVGIDLIFGGWIEVMLALSARKSTV